MVRRMPPSTASRHVCSLAILFWFCWSISICPAGFPGEVDPSFGNNGAATVSLSNLGLTLSPGPSVLRIFRARLDVH
jgi:hypothetical protein